MNDSRLIAAADEFGTPLYVFDEEPLRERVALLEDVLGPRATLCFAVKANPLAIPLISPYVHRFEVCSPGELRICQNVGVPAGEIVLSGVAKDEALIRGLLDAGAEVHRYTVESRRQFDMLLELAREYARPLPLLLRLTCGSQFGMDEADIRAIIAEHGSDPAVDIWGIQQFSGTQKTSLRRVERELARADALMEALAADYGFACREFEYGPGLPADYFAEEDPAAMREHLEGLAARLDAMAFEGPVTLEIGRGLVAWCGTYLTRVVDAKRNLGVNYAIVDGGIHHITYYGGGLGMKAWPARQLAAPDEPVEDWTICGSLCTTNDILMKAMPVAGLAPGTLLAFEKAGAYCMTEGVALLLSRDLPAVAFACADGSVRLAREALRTDPLNTPLT
ncbi:alanine racemase [uncultured Adlercreutzia sp.]|uniref:diaminopimelate decarboxylase family protein n=1 Tax=uncultured Adlercreutzia sp. TaxID=875803 RepID=UPI0026762FAF|nr:alanine racemase [uncultured Adlercreutzia sp.]